MPGALPRRLAALRVALRGLIDWLKDHVSIYAATSETVSQRSIIGACIVAERSDYRIVR